MGDDSYLGHRIELIPQSGGNLSEKEIPLEDFEDASDQMPLNAGGTPPTSTVRPGSTGRAARQ